MFISLQQLELRTVRFDVDVSPDTIEYDGTLKQASALHAEGTAELLSRALGEIRVVGKLSVSMTAPCDRCLESASISVERKFDLVYLPEEENAGAGEREIDAGAIEVGFYDGPGIELNDTFREVVLLAAPMQVVCSESCKGMCPSCGQNRNQQECGCQLVPPDDRWSKLRMLKAEMRPQN